MKEPRIEEGGFAAFGSEFSPGAVRLRDYFAAMSMAGRLAASCSYRERAHLAEDCYADADAMIAYRVLKSGE